MYSNWSNNDRLLVAIRVGYNNTDLTDKVQLNTFLNDKFHYFSTIFSQYFDYLMDGFHCYYGCNTHDTFCINCRKSFLQNNVPIDLLLLIGCVKCGKSICTNDILIPQHYGFGENFPIGFICDNCHNITTK